MTTYLDRSRLEGVISHEVKWGVAPILKPDGANGATIDIVTAEGNEGRDFATDDLVIRKRYQKEYRKEVAGLFAKKFNGTVEYAEDGTPTRIRISNIDDANKELKPSYKLYTEIMEARGRARETAFHPEKEKSAEPSPYTKPSEPAPLLAEAKPEAEHRPKHKTKPEHEHKIAAAHPHHHTPSHLESYTETRIAGHDSNARAKPRAANRGPEAPGNRRGGILDNFLALEDVLRQISSMINDMLGGINMEALTGRSVGNGRALAAHGAAADTAAHHARMAQARVGRLDVTHVNKPDRPTHVRGPVADPSTHLG